MARQYRLARKMKNITLTSAAEALGVAQPSLSAWESGKKNPTIENLIRMSELYGVSVDYLLGLSNVQDTRMNVLRPIPQKLLYILHGKPVYCEGHGWGLVDGVEKVLRFVDGQSLAITDAQECYLLPPLYSVADITTQEPLHLDELPQYERVWVEPISADAALRDELRGWYKVKSRFVENEFGQWFYLDTYNAKWLAFEDRN